MAITTVDNIVAGFTANAPDRLYIEKAAMANAVAGRLMSMWRATGQPAQGAIPSTAALCSSALLGAISFTNTTAPVYNYLSQITCANSVGVATMEVWDRLVHMGGLSGTVTTAQTVSMDVSTLAVPADRRGAANYSDLQWYLEVYSDLGATSVTASIAVTYDDASTGTLNALTIPATLRAGALIRLVDLIPTAGRYIRGITSVTLSATTGTAGSFGFTTVRYRAMLPMNVANKMEVLDWAQIGFPDVPNNSCLQLTILPTVAGTTGTLHGTGTIIHG